MRQGGVSPTCSKQGGVSVGSSLLSHQHSMPPLFRKKNLVVWKITHSFEGGGWVYILLNTECMVFIIGVLFLILLVILSRISSESGGFYFFYGSTKKSYSSNSEIFNGLFSILLVYDIKKWVNKGEPNWLYLITDILSIATAGFASSAGTAMINAGKTTAFKSISQFFVWVKKLYPTIWSKFIVPLGKSIGGIINKITKSLSNLKINKIIPDVVIKYLGKTKEYLINLKLLIEKNIEKITGKKLSKAVKGYGEYKTKSELLKSAENTELGKKVIKKMLPYINPLLGSDKIDPFIIDLIQNSNKIDLSKYNILPIFKNNSLDTF